MAGKRTTQTRRPPNAGRDEKRSAPLLFGIPQLDSLMNYPALGDVASLACTADPTSLAIVGPDGTGKSVFGLHLASSYHALVHWGAKKGQSAPNGKKLKAPPIV